MYLKMDMVEALNHKFEHRTSSLAYQSKQDEVMSIAQRNFENKQFEKNYKQKLAKEKERESEQVLVLLGILICCGVALWIINTHLAH